MRLTDCCKLRMAISLIEEKDLSTDIVGLSRVHMYYVRAVREMSPVGFDNGMGQRYRRSNVPQLRYPEKGSENISEGL
jgi:hypothetical protein